MHGKVPGRRGVQVGGWLLLAAGACSSMSSSDGAGAAMSGDSSNMAGSQNAGVVPDDSADPAANPEQEVTIELETPQAGIHYVYAASPDRDSVVVINAETLQVHTVETGDNPHYLQTLPERDAALVVNLGSSDVALVETDNAQSTATTVPIAHDSNAIAVAPDGKHAIVYFDPSRPGPTENRSYQEVTVLGLSGDELASARMSVGFRPRQVTFAGGEQGSDTAYLVTDSGISIIDLGQVDEGDRRVATTVAIFEENEGEQVDISVTRDGRYALGRIANSTKLRLVDLETSDRWTLDIQQIVAPIEEPPPGAGGAGQGGEGTAGGLPSGGQGTAGQAQAGFANQAGAANQPDPVPVTVTDLDISRDGSFALAVVRETSTVLRIPIPEAFSDPRAVTTLPIEGTIVGSVTLSPTSQWAVCYTTASPTEERVALVELDAPDTPRVIDLKKSVQAVTFTPDGQQAFVLHNKLPGDPNSAGASDDTIIDVSYGYSLIDMRTGFAKLQLTPAALRSTVVIPGQPYAFSIFEGDARTVHRMDLRSLLVDVLNLGDPPVALGVVEEAERVFVSQQHDAGRITFIDWATLDTSAVTGYEINSKIRE